MPRRARPGSVRRRPNSFRAHRRTMNSGRRAADASRFDRGESPCATCSGSVPPSPRRWRWRDARAAGDGLTAERRPRAVGALARAGSRSRPARRAGAPTSRRSSAPACRSAASACSATTTSARAGAAGARRSSGFRATSGVLIGRAHRGSAPLDADQRPAGARTGACSARRPRRCRSGRSDGRQRDACPTSASATAACRRKSGWGFSADLGVVAQSPGNVVRFGRVVRRLAEPRRPRARPAPGAGAAARRLVLVLSRSAGGVCPVQSPDRHHRTRRLAP